MGYLSTSRVHLGEQTLPVGKERMHMGSLTPETFPGRLLSENPGQLLKLLDALSLRLFTQIIYSFRRIGQCEQASTAPRDTV